MRSISQDGTQDVSYENVSMCIADCKEDVIIIPRDKIRNFCDELMNRGKTYCNPYYSEIACEIREKFL